MDRRNIKKIVLIVSIVIVTIITIFCYTLYNKSNKAKNVMNTIIAKINPADDRNNYDDKSYDRVYDLVYINLKLDKKEEPLGPELKIARVNMIMEQMTKREYSDICSDMEVSDDEIDLEFKRMQENAPGKSSDHITEHSDEDKVTDEDLKKLAKENIINKKTRDKIFQKSLEFVENKNKEEQVQE